MAVGNKGSFATVQPNTGVIDVAGMVKGGFEDLSDIQEKDFERKKQVEAAKIGIKDILADPTVAGTGQKTFDEIDYSIVSQMRDMQYDIQKKVQSGEISIAEGRAMASSYNKKLSEYTDLRKTLTPTVDSFITDYSEGKISRGLGDDWIGEQGLVTNIVDGKIEDVELDENGNPMYSEKGVNKKMYLKSVVDTINNAPRAYDLQGEAKGLAEEFISRIDVFEGVDRNDKKNYYMTFTQEGLDNNQKELIREKARSIALNPKLQNDLWFKLTGERGKYNFSEEEVQRLSNELQDKMVREVEARTKVRAEEKLGRSDALAGRKYADKRRETETLKGDIQNADIIQYRDALVSLNEAEGSDIGTQVTDAQFAGAVEIPITRNNPQFESIQGFSKGSPKTFSNFTLKGVSKLPNGVIIVRGSSLETEGTTVSKTPQRIATKINNVLSEEQKNRIKSASEDKVDDVIEDIMLETDLSSQDQTITQKTVKQSIRLPEQRKDISFVLPETEKQVLFNRAGITEDVFETAESENKSTKIKFNG